MIPATALPYLLAAVWGFLGSFAYATFRARMVLCSGEREATSLERKRAWGEYLSSPPVGAIVGAALAPTLLHLAPFLNLAGAAAVIGLFVNPFMPSVVAIISDRTFAEGLLKWLAGVFTNLGAALSKQKDKQP